MSQITWLITIQFDSGKVRHYAKTTVGFEPSIPTEEFAWWTMDCNTAICLDKVESFKIEKKEVD